MAYGKLNGQIIDNVTWRQKGQARDPNTFGAQYFENSWRYYSATIANY